MTNQQTHNPVPPDGCTCGALWTVRGKHGKPDCPYLAQPQQESANARLGLPRDKMRKLMVAYDVDGTLRCNCTPTCQKPNQRIVDMFNTEASFKNTDMYVWSGGGAAYALRFAQLYGLKVKPSHCISKIGAPRMDRVVDDIQDTAIGTQNYIVNEKRKHE